MVAVFGLSLGLLACDGLLDVENVTSIDAEDVLGPESVDLWANGALVGAQRGWDAALLLLSAASDELRFVGQFADWGELDRGHLLSPENSGLANMYRLMAPAQWFANEASRVLDSLRVEGDLPVTTPLARVYLYSAIMHASVADALEDYAPSHLTEPGPALGPENMGSLYDRAVEHATAGLALAPGGALERDLLAARARARHAHAVWRRIRPPPADASGEGLVSGRDAAVDALAAIARDADDWWFEFEAPPGVSGSNAVANIACGIFNFRFGDRYARPDAEGLHSAAVILEDPIDGVPDPSVHRFIFEVVHVPGPCANRTLTVTGAREMHLIVAEDALARGDTGTFASHVNGVRTMEGLSPWAPESGLSARDMLVHERRTRLFFMGRRLADMYRFGIHSDSWEPNSVAATSPGTLYPIPADEVGANCFLNGSCR